MQQNSFTPLLVMSIHGIRTRAQWQGPLSSILTNANIKYIPYNFGYYNLLRFLLKQSNDKMVDLFYEYYSNSIKDDNLGIDTENYLKRPSVVVHSFGSYIVGYCMLKYPDVKFDKIILCGSILPRDFPWTTLYQRDQVNHVQNEYGLYDIWTKWVGYFVKKTGNSGAYGFTTSSRHLKQIRFDYFKHSDYFRGQHIEKFWLPFLKKNPCQYSIRHGRDFEDVTEFSQTLDYTGTILDKKCYGNLVHYNEVEIPRGLSLSWIKINPDIYTFLYDQPTGIVKGYINAMPIVDDAYEQLKKGMLNDNDITSDHLLPYLNDQKVKIYLMSIALDPDARNVNEGLIYLAFEKLINGFINKLTHYFTHSNIQVTEFLAIGWTSEGKRLCELLGMTKCGEDKYGNPVYSLNLESPNLRNNKYLMSSVKRLYETYKRNRGYINLLHVE